MKKVIISSVGKYRLNGVYVTCPCEILVDDNNLDTVKRECKLFGLQFKIVDTKQPKKLTGKKTTEQKKVTVKEKQSSKDEVNVQVKNKKETKTNKK